jgi:hypothetical protein
MCKNEFFQSSGIKNEFFKIHGQKTKLMYSLERRQYFDLNFIIKKQNL